MIIFYTIFTFIFGLLIGSFLNCLIWRLHTGETMGGRSYCPKCRHKISWYDNLPVLSFIILRGRCRHCQKPISIQYPLVEFITGLLFTLAFLVNIRFQISFDSRFDSGVFELFIIHYSLFISLLRDWLVIAVMIIIFIYDLRWYLILDKVTLPAAGVILILNILTGESWLNLIFSGIIGGSIFLLQFVVSKGRWIGGGDIRLGFLMGIILGWPYVLLAIFLAYLSGSFVGLGLIAFKRKKWGSEVPFGVFLAFSTVLTLFFGSEIVELYQNLILNILNF